MNTSPRVMEVLYSFAIGGSEMLGSSLAVHMKEKNVAVSVCATHSSYGPLSESLSRYNIPCYAMDGESRTRFRRVADLYSLFRKQAIDILHIHHVGMLALCYWPARLAGVKRIVVTEHSDQHLLASERQRIRAHRYCNRADLVTVIHEGLMDYFVGELGVKEDKVVVIPNGVDVDRFRWLATCSQVRQALGFVPDNVVIGCVGRLHAS